MSAIPTPKYMTEGDIGLDLFGFLWALRNGPYDDIDGAEHRVLRDD